MGVCFRDSVSSNPAHKGTHSAAFQYRLRCPCPFTLFFMQKSKPPAPPTAVSLMALPTGKVAQARFFVARSKPGRLPRRRKLANTVKPWASTGTRTPNLMLTTHPLCRLSYGGIYCRIPPLEVCLLRLASSRYGLFGVALRPIGYGRARPCCVGGALKGVPSHLPLISRSVQLPRIGGCASGYKRSRFTARFNDALWSAGRESNPHFRLGRAAFFR